MDFGIAYCLLKPEEIYFCSISFLVKLISCCHSNYLIISLKYYYKKPRLNSQNDKRARGVAYMYVFLVKSKTYMHLHLKYCHSQSPSRDPVQFSSSYISGASCIKVQLTLTIVKLNSSQSGSEFQMLTTRWLVKSQLRVLYNWPLSFNIPLSLVSQTLILILVDHNDHT